MLSLPRPLLIWGALHLLLWSLIPALSTTCLPLDTVEAIMWGNAWEWGYDKHPPLSAWVAKFFFEIGRDLGLYFLSALCVVIAGFGIYRIARLHHLSPARATMAVLVLELIYYYQYISIEFNVNILQLPFWAWGWYCGIRAARPHDRTQWLHWLGLGLCIGLGALTKYLAVWLLIPLFAYWLRRGQLIQVLKSPGLYLAALTSALLFLPHLLWMHEHEYMTLTYGMKRADGESASFLTRHLWYPVEYILSQGGILIPALIVFFCGRSTEQSSDDDTKGLDGLAWGGLLFLGALSLLFGIRPVTMWASPMPLALGLWGVSAFRIPEQSKSAQRGALIMGSLGLLAIIIVYGLAPFYKGKPEKLNYPGQTLASLAEQAWYNQTNHAPLQYVIGKEWEGAIVATYAKERPELMIRANLERSPYLTDELVQQHGALIIWEKSRKAHDGRNPGLAKRYPDLQKRFPHIKVLDDLIIDWPHWKDGLQGRFGLALIPPHQN